MTLQQPMGRDLSAARSRVPCRAVRGSVPRGAGSALLWLVAQEEQALDSGFARDVLVGGAAVPGIARSVTA